MNGTAKEVGALNVNNSTYIKLSDAGDALGTKVAFNSDKKQIEIGENSSTSYKKGDFTVTLYDGVEYVAIGHISKLYKSKYEFGWDSATKTANITNISTQKTILDNIPVTIVVGSSCVSLEYFEKTIKPLLN